MFKVNSRDPRTRPIDAVAVSFGVSHLKWSLKKAVLKNFAIFTGKQQCLSLFLIKLQDVMPATLLERDSNTGDFLWILSC